MPDVPLHSFMSDDGAQLSVLRDGSADLSFVRLPVEREGLSVIPLYEEQPVVVAPKGHEISLFEEVDLADLSARPSSTCRNSAAPSGPAGGGVRGRAGDPADVRGPAFQRQGHRGPETHGCARHGDRPGLAQRRHGRGHRGIHRDCPRTHRGELPPALGAAGETQDASPSRTGAAPEPPRSPRWRSVTRQTRTRAAARDPGKRGNAKAMPRARAWATWRRRPEGP